MTTLRYYLNTLFDCSFRYGLSFHILYFDEYWGNWNIDGSLLGMDISDNHVYVYLFFHCFKIVWHDIDYLNYAHEHDTMEFLPVHLHESYIRVKEMMKDDENRLFKMIMELSEDAEKKLENYI